MASTSQRMWVSKALLMSMCLFLLGLIGRLVYIHTQLSPELLAWSRERQFAEIELPGRRGSILDRRFRVLAGSHDRPTIYADPVLVENPIEAAQRLAVVLNMPAAEISKKLNNPSSRRYVVIRRHVEPVEAEGVRSLHIKGIEVSNEPARVYPMGSLASHVLGFVGREGNGLEGVELACDKYLRPTAGKRVVFRDVLRRPMFQEADSYIPPQDGMHVVLTIDAAIQETLEKAVTFQVDKHKAESGLGIVINPKTGEVLAMACVPTYEPANGGNFPTEIRRNRILTDPVEPGSIFKPYTMVTALAEGVTTPDEVIDCSKGNFGRRRLHDHHPYGKLTTELIMVKSSNIGMAHLGVRLGNERLYKALRNFGFGQLTGIDLPGESEGLLMPLRAWNSYSTTSVPMGQELAVTPIQVVAAFSSLVNGGWLIKPKVVQAVINAQGEVIEDRRDPIIHRQAVDPTAAATMQAILVQVVNKGTGKRCQLDKWHVLGKTGTAQVPWKHRRGYEPGAYLASFIAAAPATDPSVVVLVMIRKPTRNGYYGSQAALPAVKTTLEQTLSYLNIPSDKNIHNNHTQLVQAHHD